MGNPSKEKGTKAETKVARYLTEHGLPTVRKALAGSSDEGDLRMLSRDGTEVAIEVKAGKQTANPSRSQLTEWQRQTLAESLNSGCPAMLIIVRYRRLFADSEVWIPAEEWGERGWTMVHIDDYAEEMGG
ncbi:MAG: hypothetical protein K5859_03625 [Atopobiaceae bacterium]|nr:hypothetical protein [Atopobiaceae bacterium]